ncbi:hypothetical protein [Isoptericola sp. NPDC057391]|uniref:hypothetical protein n=1 Tax=Isoptericola sp. NPDC057391 TaxID=3346117 RepID=UPI00362C90E0
MALPGQFKFQAVCAGLFAVLGLVLLITADSTTTKVIAMAQVACGVGLVLLAFRDGRRANTRRDELDAEERQA